jgi:hypothetical protein
MLNIIKVFTAPLLTYCPVFAAQIKRSAKSCKIAGPLISSAKPTTIHLYFAQEQNNANGLPKVHQDVFFQVPNSDT